MLQAIFSADEVGHVNNWGSKEKIINDREKNSTFLARVIWQFVLIRLAAFRQKI